MTWESAEQISNRIRVSSTLGGMYSPHCAVVNPWKLVTGLARTIENLGVVIYEDSRALFIEPRRVVLERGEVRAKWVVNALESFTSQLPAGKRKIVPLYSLMVATEPLSESVWRSLGWAHRETFADGRNMVTYAQRTADDRIAFGGRGAPYHFGSSISDRYDRNKTIHGRLEQTVREIFPQVAEAKFTHHWGGPVGAPRDWHAFANVDAESGLCAGGGYVGDGVALSNLVGRTLAHQIANTGDALTRCALVNHRSKKWEVEPLRWLGVNALLALTEYADKAERRTHRPMKRLLALRDGLLG
jgi:glycine/D-amino acid oxidase-like deaminating enzyme